MVLKIALVRNRACVTGSVLIIAFASISVDACAAMRLDQMKLLKGSAQLELTIDSLLSSCGLPAAIVDQGPPSGPRQSIKWRNVGMRLSALDWTVLYGESTRTSRASAGWTNDAESSYRCAGGLSRLSFASKGHVGILSVTKKPHDFGYITTYTVPKSLFKAHKVVGVEATLVKSFPVSTLRDRYGLPDEVFKQPGGREKYRYWVHTLRDHRPELLYAVDFEIDGAGVKTYAISTSGMDFVQQRLDSMLKQWERDYVLD